jgi:IS1 family transposase
MTGYGGRLWRVFGERTLATLERLLGLLSAFEVVVWMTDGWRFMNQPEGRTARYQQAIYAAH